MILIDIIFFVQPHFFFVIESGFFIIVPAIKT